MHKPFEIFDFQGGRERGEKREGRLTLYFSTEVFRFTWFGEVQLGSPGSESIEYDCEGGEVARHRCCVGSQFGGERDGESGIHGGRQT